MTPNDAAKLWTVADVADYLGVKTSTIRAYMAREQMPEPDLNFGRKPVWHESTIRAWRP